MNWRKNENVCRSIYLLYFLMKKKTRSVAFDYTLSATLHGEGDTTDFIIFLVLIYYSI